MAAINRFLETFRFNSREELLSQGISCVFISHQKADNAQAKKIGDFLQQAGVEIYFDEYDKEVKTHHDANNPKALTRAICNGINNSSHMLVVVSQHTLTSNWVPFEIGYGFEKTELYILCLKDIARSSLPEYMHAGKIIRDTNGLKKLVRELKGKPEDMPPHFLEDIMDECIAEEETETK